MKPSKPVTFKLDQEVLARWNDGLFYLGSIVKIDEKNGRCSVSFEDNSEYWILYKDIQIGAIQGEIVCCICQEEASDKPNEIVLCDNCGLGYHQQCHNPPIQGDVLKPDVEFLCRLCVFATNVKKGGALKMGPNAKTFQDMKRSLPYNLHRLTWDAQHKTNVEQYYCYCGGPGDWYSKMLQCCRCRQWFHEACIQCLEHPLLYGDRFYVFVCCHCNNGPEYIKRIEMKWVDLLQLVLFNLTIQGVKKYYDIEEVVAPFIINNLQDMQVTNLDVGSMQQVQHKITEICQHHKTRFCSGREIRKKSTLWGLRVRIPPPAPTIILPIDGPITDDVMANLQMKGKKTKTFVPIQCNSPIPLRYRKNGLDIDDSIVFKSEKAKKLLQEATTKNVLSECHSFNQSYTGYDGSPIHTTFFSEFEKFVSAEPKSRSKPTRLKQFSLDNIIPHVDSFEGANHPFKTELEQNAELEQKKYFQQKILDICESISLSESASLCETTSLSEVDNMSCTSCDQLEDQLETPLILGQKRRRSQRQLFNIDINRNVRKRKRKSKSSHVENVVSSEVIEAVKNTQVDINKLKSKVGSYLGKEDRLAQTDKFNVIAQRVTVEGKIQYLVEWD
ncbi:hypothetical protein SNE40_001498 [Patella caerulea]|uniref:PHD-type domain-containing protein n=1 Tax=Patella caerulea TaxID=87958 RepID=A0AAN8KHP8_PATCE